MFNNVMTSTPLLPKHHNDIIMEKIVWRFHLTGRKRNHDSLNVYTSGIDNRVITIHASGRAIGNAYFCWLSNVTVTVM